MSFSLVYILLDAHLTLTLRTTHLSSSPLPTNGTPVFLIMISVSPLIKQHAGPSLRLISFFLTQCMMTFPVFSQRVGASLNTFLDHPTNSGEYMPSSASACHLHQIKGGDLIGEHSGHIMDGVLQRTSRKPSK